MADGARVLHATAGDVPRARPATAVMAGEHSHIDNPSPAHSPDSIPYRTEKFEVVATAVKAFVVDSGVPKVAHTFAANPIVTEQARELQAKTAEIVMEPGVQAAWQRQAALDHTANHNKVAAVVPRHRIVTAAYIVLRFPRYSLTYVLLVFSQTSIEMWGCTAEADTRQKENFVSRHL